MAARKDSVQISIAFLTDESKEYAKLINKNREFAQELKATAKAGGDLTAVLDKMAASGQAAAKIDLSQLAPAQLNARAKQLAETINLIPQSAPQYKILNDELKGINSQLATIRESNKGVAAGGQAAFAAASGGARAFLTALGPIALGLISLQTLFEGVKKLFEIGTDAEALQTKMAAVFGESANIVKDFSEKNAAAIGLSRREYQGLATDVGDLLTPMGFTKQTAAELSVELVNQAGVLSRWTKGKVDTKTATEILNKSLLGERDALNSLGIDIKDATIQAELKRKGLEKLTGNELRQAEALITLEQITKQSSNANAAFAKQTEDLQEKKAKLRSRISEIVDGMGKGMIPVFNKVLGVIIPVVDWIVNFGTSLFNLIQRAETFRAVVSAAFGGVASAISGVVRGIGAVADGFVNLFSGEFSKAADSFGTAFSNLNPVGVGINLANGVVDGWKSVKSPTAEVAPADQGKAEGEGRKLASAFGGGYDAQFAIIKANSKKSKEDVAKEAKEALELDLKALQAATLRKETILEGERLANTKNEIQYGNELVAIKKTQLEESLQLYKKYAKDQTVEALKLQNELAKLNADNARPGVAPLAQLGGRPLGGVQSEQAGTATKLAVLGVDEAAQEGQLKIVKDKLLKTVEVEQQYEEQRLQMKRNYLAQEIAILKEATNPQVDEIKSREEQKAKIEAEISQGRIENEKRLEALRTEVLQQGLQTTGDIFAAAAEILGKDEASKKKHAETIKALQKANVTINLFSEVSSIFANAQKSPVAQLLGPIAGNVLATIQAGLATARAGIAIGKIESTKFERGKLLQFGRGAQIGFFGGNYHSAGGTQLVGSDGSRFEVERDEAFAVVNRRNAPMLRMLSRINSMNGHGDPYFARGGLATVSTTPSFSVQDTSSTASGNTAQLDGLMAEIAGLRADVANWQRYFKVQLVYSDIQATGKVVNTITNEANF
jgi:hypothetical protein